MTSEDTAVPFPYVRLIVGTRHYRVLVSGNINSDATGIDITRLTELARFDRRLDILEQKSIHS